MGSDRIEELLLQLIQDMAEVKAKFNNMEEQKLSNRIESSSRDFSTKN